MLLEQFNLTQHADTYAGELSGGQRRLRADHAGV